MNPETLGIYYKNAERIDDVNNKVIINPKASLAFKNAMRANEPLFAGYIMYFIRPYKSPYDGNGTLTFEPHFEQIFGTSKTFKKMLDGFNFKDRNVTRIKAIILAVFDEFITSDKTPFKIKDRKDKLFINKIMRENGVPITTNS